MRGIRCRAVSKGWIIVEQVQRPGGKSELSHYPRSGKIAKWEEAETLKAAYAPVHGGQIVIIRVSEFYSRKRPRSDPD
jgi:hypothetical protein